VGFRSAAPQLAAEALQLLAAPDCPSEVMDVLLAPDQMILQIHESIGHPLELDRILGDERNFAGTSFVTPDLFGTYRYGSDLLNVTFDPTRGEELASYGWDDDRTPAERVHFIKNGNLERPLDRERQARRGRQESQLPRHQRELLAQPRARRQRRHGAGARHAALRQRRAVAGDPRRPRVAGVRVHER